MIVAVLALIASEAALAVYTSRLYGRLLRVVAAVQLDAPAADVTAALFPAPKRREREPEPTITPIGL